MRLTAGWPLLPLLLLCFNSLAAENRKSDFGDHDGFKERRSNVEALGKRSKDYMEMAVDDPAANTPLAEFPCPVATAIEPCVCSTGSGDNRLYLDCTLVESEEQLAAVFQQEFPVKEFYQFSMSSNSAVEVFHNFMNGITFESLVLAPGSFALEAISDYFLLNLKDTVEIIQIQNSELMADVFPFILLPLMSELSTLQFFGSDIKRIPPIRAPNLSHFAVTSSPVERLLNGTISVGTGATFVSLYHNNISTIEPGSIFFADEESAASSEPLTIDLVGNKIQSLQAGTFHLRNGYFQLHIYSNQIASIEPGTFVLPEAPGDARYGGIYIDLAPNEIQSLQAGTFPLINGDVNLFLYSNSISSIEPGTFQLPEATGDASYREIIDLAHNQIQSLQAGTFPLRNGEVFLSLHFNNISYIEPGTFQPPEATGDASDGILYINLQDNLLQSLQAGTFPLRNDLVEIILSSNKISSIEPGTFQLPEATESMDISLDLGDNELTTIDEAVFGDLMPFISYLDLNANPLICGCDIAWLIRNTDYMSVVGSFTSCADGTLLSDLNPQDFVDWCLV